MFAFTDNDQWMPGIGDPSLMGWLTVVAYVITAWLSGRAALRSFKAGRARLGLGLFWCVFCAGLILLGINKQLDLQTWLTLFLKHWAQDEGWYRARRTLQAAFIAAVALGGVVGLVGMKLLAGHATRPILLALAGGIFLGCFILVRASSFHHVDRMLGMDFGGVKVNWMLELGSLSCIALAAWLAGRGDQAAREKG